VSCSTPASRTGTYSPPSHPAEIRRARLVASPRGLNSTTRYRHRIRSALVGEADFCAGRGTIPPVRKGHRRLASSAGLAGFRDVLKPLGGPPSVAQRRRRFAAVKGAHRRASCAPHSSPIRGAFLRECLNSRRQPTSRAKPPDVPELTSYCFGPLVTWSAPVKTPDPSVASVAVASIVPVRRYVRCGTVIVSSTGYRKVSV
jgi:hypothetical protein